MCPYFYDLRFTGFSITLCFDEEDKDYFIKILDDERKNI